MIEEPKIKDMPEEADKKKCVIIDFEIKDVGIVAQALANAGHEFFVENGRFKIVCSEE